MGKTGSALNVLLRISTLCVVVGAAQYKVLAAQEVDSSDVPGASAQDGAIAEFVPHAPFRSFMLTAEDAAGTYYSIGAKATFTFGADGKLSLVQDGDEPVINSTTDEATDFQCMEHGGGYNQRTAWFPYTALFVRGGELDRVRSADGDMRKLRALSVDEDGSVVYRGDGQRSSEYSFVPCVGSHRAEPGVRLDSYLNGSDRLMLRMANGKQMHLRLPQPFAPFLLARYESGAMIPVPVRIVVASIDLIERRLVLQMQSTVAMTPPVRKLELRAIMKGGEPAAGESASRHRARTQAVLSDLARCAKPIEQAIEPCADSTRKPDPRIFLSAGFADPD